MPFISCGHYPAKTMILINGESKEHIEISDRGFQYGDGLFETIEVRDGQAVFLDAHLERLNSGCQRLYIPFPDVDLLRLEADRLCRQWVHTAHSGRAVLKIIITRGSGGRGYRQPDDIKPTRLLSLHPYPDYPATYLEQGVVARFCITRLGLNSVLAGIKHLNRLEQVMARAEWTDPGIQEGLMLDADGYVIEGTMTNLFYVKDNSLCTAVLARSGVAGIMRGIIIKLAAEQGLSVIEHAFTKEELLAADEIFVCNSIIGIWPVRQIETAQFSVGPITKNIQLQLDSLIADDCKDSESKATRATELDQHMALLSRKSTIRGKIIVCTVLILSVIGGGMWMDYRNALQQTVTADKTVYIEIEKGDSLNRIIDKLIAQKLEIKPFWFKAAAFQQNAFKKLKAGEYELTPGLTVPKILALFVQGKTKQHAITFPEGWSFKEILREIEKNPNLEHTLSGVAFESVMGRFKPDAGTPALPEGLFFPDTYFFEKHTSDVSLLKRAYDKMQQVLQQEWLNKAEGLPFKTPYDALILASIVEKETGVAAERPQIAGVFIRRLEQNMLLQTDPTVIYGMGESYQGDIKVKDLTTATPYNTYVIRGLPPTPIAMPGRDALYAVLHPDKGDSLYFVARGDGTHVFSATLKDHNLAVDTFQRNKK